MYYIYISYIYIYLYLFNDDDLVGATGIKTLLSVWYVQISHMAIPIISICRRRQVFVRTPSDTILSYVIFRSELGSPVALKLHSEYPLVN